MKKRKALGKGLDALISSDKKNPKENELKKVRIKNIVPNKYQPRKKFDEEEIDELASSIEANGLIQPIVVRKKKEDLYEIISGERRYRALKKLDVKKVPVIIKQIKSEEQMLVMAMIENLQRENLNPIEESMGFKKLRDDYDLVQKDIAKIVGKSRTYITNSLRLLKLDEKTKKELENKNISAGHGRALLGINDIKYRHKVLEKIKKEALSVREVEKIVSNQNKIKKKKKKKEKKRDPEIVAIEDKLQEKFGTKVSIKKQKKGGAIKIKFYKDKDLQRIMEILEVQLD